MRIIPYLFTVFLIMTLLLSCRNQHNRDINSSQLSAQIDSLRMEVHELRNIKDTIHDTVVTVRQSKQLVMAPTTKPRVEIPITPNMTEKQKQTNDTDYYYYNFPPRNRSAIVTPWQNGRRKIILYNPTGTVTYTIDDAKLGYSNISGITNRHPNGAINEISQHFNPGASMYMYSSVISFDTDNSPLWRTDKKEPETLEEEMHSKSYWDKKSLSWKKQEIAKESQIPGINEIH